MVSASQSSRSVIIRLEIGNAVDVRLFGLSVDSNDDDWTPNASVSYLLDQKEQHTQAECLKVNHPCRELKFSVQELQNGEHTLVLITKSLNVSVRTRCSACNSWGDLLGIT